MINKTVIVTGASGNMGQAVIKKFLAEGYNVVGTIVPNDATLFEMEHARLEKIIVDLMSEEDTAKFIQTVIAKYGNVDAAVLTVGGFAMGKIESTSAADILKQYKLNFETAYHVARPVFVQMVKQRSGRIFMAGSKPGLDAKNGKGMVAYGLGKSLIFRLAELMNEEAKGTNVVTAILVPSTIDTPANRKSMPDADFNNWIKPEDIANVIYYYCTSEATMLREPVIKLYNNA
ncbi:MAG: SDR family NAD(P)-dependent oxidoreductase [Ferruginibacter sp.]|nr:SDR family NAD(P)-dependent oxidoreductase [Ferruginibacter sp.]